MSTILAKAAADVNKLERPSTRLTANRNGSLDEQLLWVLETVFEGIELISIGIVQAVIWLCMKSYALYIFFIIGEILVIFRQLIIILCPVLASASGLIADIINLMIEAWDKIFNPIFRMYRIIYSYMEKDIISVVNAIAKAFGQKGLGSIPIISTKPWKPIKEVNPNDIRSFLTNVPPVSTQFSSLGKIVLWSIRLGLSPYTCPIVRYMTPLEQTYHTSFFRGLLWWSYYGGANPVLFDSQQNCVRAKNTNVDPVEVFCIAIGSGFLFQQFFLPVTILRAIVPSLWPGLHKFQLVASFFAERVWEVGDEVIASFFHAALVLSRVDID